MYDESPPIIQNPGSGLAQIGAQGGRIVTEMVSGALALSKASPSLVPRKMKDLPGAIMGEGVRTQPVTPSYKVAIPPEKRAAFHSIVEGFIADGINTPEKLAASLTRIGIPARQFSRAVWATLGTVDTSLPDVSADQWQAIYSELDKPAAPVSSKPLPSTKTASPRTNS